MAPPGRSATGRTPQAAARSPYSPLGSTTQARRPNTASRQRKVLTKALLPRPIWPNTTMFGLETTPAAYSSKGSKTKEPPSRSSPITTPRPPRPASAMKG